MMNKRGKNTKKEANLFTNHDDVLKSKTTDLSRNVTLVYIISTNLATYIPKFFFLFFLEIYFFISK